MAKTLKLYLAHNLDIRHEIRQIELMLEKKYNVKLFNPFYDSKRNDIDRIDNGSKDKWELTMKECKDIVENDLSNITKQDGVLAIVKEPSIGTTLEIAHARINNKLIFVISEKYINHPWIRVYVDYCFRSIKEFEYFLIGNGYRR